MSAVAGGIPFPLQHATPVTDIYANSLRLGMTMWDFTLVFGATEDTGPGVIGVRDRATVRLSPSMLKFVVLNLQNALAAYEDAIGTIPFATEYEAEINSNKQKFVNAIKAQISQIKTNVEASSPGD